MTRRDFLKLSAAASASLVFSAFRAAPSATTAGIRIPATTETPALSAAAVQSAKPTRRRLSLRDLAARIKVNGQPFRIGTSVDDLEGEHQQPLLLQTASEEFAMLVPATAFGYPLGGRWIGKCEAGRYWAEFAERKGMTLRIQLLHWQHDAPEALALANRRQDRVRAHMENRFRRILSYASQTIPSEIVLARTPFREHNGERGWAGAEGGSDVCGVFGEEWIAEAYVALYRVAQQEFHLIPGRDLRIVGIVERGIDSPGPRTDWFIQQVKNIKQSISSRLPIPFGEIPFDLGSEFRVGDGCNDRDVAIPFSQVNKDKFKRAFVQISEGTGCRMHAFEITELASVTGNETAVAESYQAILEAAIESGVVDSAEFAANFRFGPVSAPYWGAKFMSPWQNKLFLPGFKKGSVYQTVWDALSKYAA